MQSLLRLLLIPNIKLSDNFLFKKANWMFLIVHCFVEGPLKMAIQVYKRLQPAFVAPLRHFGAWCMHRFDVKYF